MIIICSTHFITLNKTNSSYMLHNQIRLGTWSLLAEQNRRAARNLSIPSWYKDASQINTEELVKAGSCKDISRKSQELACILETRWIRTSWSFPVRGPTGTKEGYIGRTICFHERPWWNRHRMAHLNVALFFPLRKREKRSYPQVVPVPSFPMNAFSTCQYTSTTH